MPAILVAAVVTAASICAKSEGSLADLRAKMVLDVVPFADMRTELVELLRNGKGGRCRESLQDFVSNIVSGKEKDLEVKGRLTLILLAANGTIPDSTKVLEMEVASGRGNELLDTLRAADETAYERTLRSWMAQTAAAIRSVQSMTPTGDTAYGRTTLGSEKEEKAASRLLNPLIIERRLAYASEKKSRLSEEEIADMNAIFAGSTTAYRDAFSAPFRNVLATNVTPWIASFRKEAVWVQARLFPLMTLVGGPEVVRELMWLADNHADLRIRAMADRSLDELLKMKKSR